ncbi:hypothetical protein EZH22_19840 [Xanthobacter dioxanivorans]|uniref:Uncharacterized protein n=1 Tax=Xanthobacter dioxanivorans TaxID=2528964 RepID=A0A974PL27_9HYPH|nr:hypothetical protein [Xanthobacter dioxanivorans]QRG05328.1 hypothetical protein EZH22_19840 [Xanthobacter dioxanivorans]
MQDPNEARQEREFRSPDGRTSQGAPVTASSKARQGVTSGRVLVILAVGVLLVIVGFAASYVGAV